MTVEVTVHTFSMGDVSDPEIYCAIFVEKWRETDRAKWIETHCENIRLRREADESLMGWRYSVLAEFAESTLTEYRLRFTE